MSVANDDLMQMYTSIFEQKRIRKFPGALPTTVTRKNKILLHYGFLVTLKADGDRCFAIIIEKKLFLHRRDGAITSFDLPTSFALHVFDCEFLEHENLLLIFDTLVYAEHAAYRLSLEQRSELVNHFLTKTVPKDQLRQYSYRHVNIPNLITPIASNYNVGTTWQLSDCGLKIENKPWYNFKDAATLWDNRKMVPYGVDGLIFGRLLCVYSPFSENPESVYKWKPEVTIDFMMIATHDNRRENFEVDKDVLSMLNRDRSGMDQLLHPSDEYRTNYKLYTCNERSEFLCVTRCRLQKDENLDRKIGEFRWDKQSRSWHLERIRDDKYLPNNLMTTTSSLESILDDLTVNDIIT